MTSTAVCFYSILAGMVDMQRVALVTGGAKRVGRAIVERLADAGFDIAFTYRGSKNEARALTDDLAARGRAAIAIQADFTQLPTAIDAVENEFRAAFGRLDVLVNNASIYEPASLAATDLALMRRLWAVHAEAPLLLAQRFAADLRRSRGHIVNMVDLLAERPLPRYLAYCASKAALLNLTLGLARELAPEVTVNGIAPGTVEWPEGYPVSEQEKYLKRVPLGRTGTPNDVAETVLFLCTAGTYITGQIIRLDGGRSIT
ncbi:MAG: dehydrogenase, short-chain alcohol dehydrogenase like protein [Phycisphaerales bacterium]|nr:dehydrogenase, short-chain alcohol dehydrogenase like protein [Phycisphaerales bacterium]